MGTGREVVMMVTGAWVVVVGGIGDGEKSSEMIMWQETPALKSWTWRWMYQRKASLDHLPMSMMV
jgi:hypothetical protein